MWVRFSPYGDAVPEAGAVLTEVGIRAWCTSVIPVTAEVDSVVAVQEVGDAPPTDNYVITGTAGVARGYTVDEGHGNTRHAGSEWVLTAAEEADVHQFLGASPALAAATPSGRVRATCRLMIIADYQWDAFDLPDVRRDWVVAAVEHGVGDEDVLLNLTLLHTGRCAS